MSSRPARSLASTFGGHSPNGGPSLVAVPPIMLRPPEAAAALGMSLDTFNRLVRPHVRAYRSHKLKLYPTAELERWALENATPVLGGDE